MKFIVDAQLPKRLARWLSSQGHDAIHTLDLPKKNLTSDLEISALSIKEQRIVITKDADFYDRYFQKLEPWKLIFLTVGNISTDDLMLIFKNNMSFIESEITYGNVIEVTRFAIITID